MNYTRLLLLSAAAALSACADQSPTASEPAAPPAREVRMLTCTASVDTHAIRCADGSSQGPSKIIYGSQGRDVRVNSSNVNYDPITQLYTFDVSVTNLRREAIGTRDGVRLDPKGVRLYFGSGPTVTDGIGVVLPLNPDGTDIFILKLSPYYQYNQVLQPGQTSIIKGWTFLVPITVKYFTFNLYVATEIGPAAT